MIQQSREQELKDRLNLIEAMIAEGRQTTASWGWAFVLWGIAYYVAIAWSIWGNANIAWPVTMIVAAVITGHLIGRRLRRQKRRAVRARDAQRRVPTAATTRIRVGAQPNRPGGPPPSAAPTTRIPTGAPGTPRIFRGDDSATRQISVPKPKIYRPPQDST